MLRGTAGLSTDPALVVGAEREAAVSQRELLARAAAALPGPGPLRGTFGVAPYRYALDGETIGSFTQEARESAVRPKKGRRNAPPTATPGTV